MAGFSKYSVASVHRTSSRAAHVLLRIPHKFSKRVFSWNMHPGHSRPHWKRSGVVGASCFLYMLPAIAYYQLSTRMEDIFVSLFTFCLGLCYIAVTFVSFLADYVYIPTMSSTEVEDWHSCIDRNTRYPPSKWGRRDRMVSQFVGFLSLLEGCARIGPLMSLFVVFVCMVCILLSRSARSPRSWIYRHSFWHLTSSTSLYLLASIYAFSLRDKLI